MRLGLDLGGTKIAGVILNTAGDIVHEDRLPTPNQGYDAIIAALIQLIHQLEQHVQQRCSIGIGTPGALHGQPQHLKNCNITALNGRPFLADLQKALQRPVRMANDANCFALSESKDGAAKGAKLVFGVILGTGVGGGIVVNGEVHMGPNGIGGEWGHAPLPLHDDGPLCYCGKRGCIETMLSGPALLRDYQRHGGKRAESTTALVALAQEQVDPLAVSALARYCENFGLAMATVVNILDPDVIVLGGGMSNVAALFDKGVRCLEHYAFSQKLCTQVVRNQFGDHSGVRGAAWLWDP